MKALFSSFDRASESEPMMLWRRCLSALQIVASVWMLMGIIAMTFMRAVPSESPMHTKLQIISIGCVLVAAGLYSVLIPLYFIQRNREV